MCKYSREMVVHHSAISVSGGRKEAKVADRLSSRDLLLTSDDDDNDFTFSLITFPMNVLAQRSASLSKGALGRPASLQWAARNLMTTSVLQEEDWPEKAERPRGIPLARDLGGIRVSNERSACIFLFLNIRISCSRLVTGPSLSNRLTRYSESRQPHSGSEPGFQRKPLFSRPNGSQNGAREDRPAMNRMPRSTSQPSHKREEGERPAAFSERPQRQRTDNGDRRNKPFNKQDQSSQPKFSSKSFAAPKTLTEQVEGRAGPRSEWPKNEKKQGSRKPKKTFARRTQGGSATSDYSGGKDDNPRQPRRDYDGNGLLVLKSPHRQISQVLQPMLPAFTPLPTTSSTPSPTSGKSTVVSVSNALGGIPYVSRALPTDASGISGEPRTVMDNARLALSRVRELNNRKRKNALSIVQRLVDSKVAGARKPATIPI